MGLIKKMLDGNKRELKILSKIATNVMALENEIAELSDADIRNKTIKYQTELKKLNDYKKQEKYLDDILPEAYAIVREAAWRILGMKPFKVQIMGGAAIHRGDIAQMRTGEGKSSPVFTKIPTPTGWRQMGDIKPGDYIFDRLGKPTKVTSVHPQGVIDTYEVTFKDGRKVLCGEEHLWNVYNGYRAKDWETLSTRDLIDQGVLLKRGYRFSVPTSKEVEYPENKLDIDPYVLGYMLGNGCKNKGGNLFVSSDDEFCINELNSLIGADRYQQSKHNYTWHFYKEKDKNKILKANHITDNEQLINLLTDTYSYNKYIPDEYKLTTIENRWKILQGLFDSDGGIYRSDDGGKSQPRFVVRYSTKSKQLCDDIMEIIYSLGLSCSCGPGKKNAFIITVNCDNNIKDKFFRLPRKKEIAMDAKNYVKNKNYDRLAIINIKKLEPTEQVCFVVDNPEHLYLTDLYIVTHNTLTATMPVYLNALTGRGIHVVTVNEYLSKTQAEEMSQLYEFLGLSVGINLNELSTEEKRNAYKADITYSTNNELGFDYLRDNMVSQKEERVMRPLNFAVIDEVDSILIDEARTPLIISGQAEKSTNLYIQSNVFVKMLKKDVDYNYDEKTKGIQLTEIGIDKAEKMFKIDNLYDVKNVNLIHHINIALKANHSMVKNFDYVVQDGEILIVDQFTGRTMPGRRFSDGIHQAIEAKEGVEIQNESKTMASITFQNFFRMYNKLSGMTGTAKTEEEELMSIYNMAVTQIPTNNPVARIDDADLIFASEKGKLKAVVDEVIARHKKGQPVLLGTVAVETSEYISDLLKKRGIRHNVLNAKNHEQEAEIIAKAGQKDAVTIATNMAGRGTDIKLGEGVKELGGLAVLGTERHESRRIDDQLRGRAGRQGDPGYSRFYLSLQDELMIRFGTERMQSMMKKLGMNDETPIESKMVSNAVESAQKRVEGNNYDSRKRVLEYDDVLRKQREIIYEERNEILESEDCSEMVHSMIEQSVKRAVNYHFTDDDDTADYETFKKYIEDMYLTEGVLNIEDIKRRDNDEIYNTVMNIINKQLEHQKLEMGEQFLEFERMILLRTIDAKWTDHIDTMDQLRTGIHLRSYGQINPLREYQNEGLLMFEAMLENIEDDVSKFILKSSI